jgi:hypothetical protein
MIEVTFSTVPGTPIPFCLEDGSTVKAVLDVIRGNDPSFDFNGTLCVNMNQATESTVLRSQDRVTLSRKIKGNQCTVRIVKMPGANIRVTVDEGSTIEHAIEVAQANPPVIDGVEIKLGDVEGFKIKLDGNDAEMDTIIPHDQQDHIVVLTKKVKGNE